MSDFSNVSSESITYKKYLDNEDFKRSVGSSLLTITKRYKDLDYMNVLVESHQYSRSVPLQSTRIAKINFRGQIEKLVAKYLVVYMQLSVYDDLDSDFDACRRDKEQSRIEHRKEMGELRKRQHEESEALKRKREDETSAKAAERRSQRRYTNQEDTNRPSSVQSAPASLRLSSLANMPPPKHKEIVNAFLSEQQQPPVTVQPINREPLLSAQPISLDNESNESKRKPKQTKVYLRQRKKAKVTKAQETKSNGKKSKPENEMELDDDDDAEYDDDDAEYDDDDNDNDQHSETSLLANQLGETNLNKN